MGPISSFLRGWRKGGVNERFKNLSAEQKQQVRQKVEEDLWGFTEGSTCDYDIILVLEVIGGNCPSCGCLTIFVHTCQADGCGNKFCASCCTGANARQSDIDFCSDDCYQQYWEAQQQQREQAAPQNQPVEDDGLETCTCGMRSNTVRTCDCPGCPNTFCRYCGSYAGKFCSSPCYDFLD